MRFLGTDCLCRYIVIHCFYYSSNRKSYFVDIFLHISLVSSGIWLYFPYHTSKWKKKFPALWCVCDINMNKKRKAVKNHKVDEWSPLSIRGENRINLHFIRKSIVSTWYRSPEKHRAKENVKWEKFVIWFSINNLSEYSMPLLKNERNRKSRGTWFEWKAALYCLFVYKFWNEAKLQNQTISHEKLNVSISCFEC